ncbi:hypothetical protein SCWH03_11650 [Streptomyces pacificus]|uniref:Uncharacterized protein n=1 Tax=Streptomyces pacificus TaxID=2705029 RepID=A0A6A0ARH0_9ACTN|nr:hypothetical protein SCWH03_11650 [Streptomyces pacificus]
MGVLVHGRADAVASELGADRVARLVGDRADGVGEVTDARSGPGGGDAGGECPFVVSIIATLSAGLASPTGKLIAASEATPP